MFNLSNLFDFYALRARLFPSLLTILPALITGISLCPALLTSKLSIAAVALVGGCGVLYALSSLTRTAGKRIEPALLRLWGGWPTTLLLRHSGSLDTHTRLRYHQVLQAKVPDLRFPTEGEELACPEKADAVYASSVRWLKQAADLSNARLVTKENAEYGFRRNLLGAKGYSITLCILSLIPALIVVAGDVLASELTFGRLQAYFALRAFLLVGLAANIAIAVLWIFVVKAQWVRQAGFQYAEALLSFCDRLNET